MKFFSLIKENSRIITSMIANQVGMTIFGLILSMATSGNDTIFLISSLFAVALYMYLLYTLAWDTGAKDGIRISGGRMEPMPLKGLYLSLAANAVNIILGIAVVATAFPSDSEMVINIHNISKLISMFIQGMYGGIRWYFMPNNPIFYILMPIPAIVICTLGYIMGTKEISIASVLGMNTKKTQK